MTKPIHRLQCTIQVKFHAVIERIIMAYRFSMTAARLVKWRSRSQGSTSSEFRVRVGGG
jgi:hypothetical protein